MTPITLSVSIAHFKSLLDGTTTSVADKDASFAK